MIIMKPWLFDILACPMDKHFPLKLYIFSYETELVDFKSFLSKYEQRDLEFIKNEKIIEIIQDEGAYFIKDNVVIEKKSIEMYLKLIVSSINELDNIIDKSSLDISKKCFEIALTEIRDKLIEFSKNININQIDSILPEIYLINKLKIDTEIESGLLFCEKCNRWFPIIETIPQMLPDEYRDKEKETQFLKTNKDLLDKEFFNQELKPFNI